MGSCRAVAPGPCTRAGAGPRAPASTDKGCCAPRSPSEPGAITTWSSRSVMFPRGSHWSESRRAVGPPWQAEGHRPGERERPRSARRRGRPRWIAAAPASMAPRGRGARVGSSGEGRRPSDNRRSGRPRTAGSVRGDRGAEHSFEGPHETQRRELPRGYPQVGVTMVPMPAVNPPQLYRALAGLPRHAQPVPSINQPEIARRAAQRPHQREQRVGVSTAVTPGASAPLPGLADSCRGRTGSASHRTCPVALPTGPGALGGEGR